MDDSVIIALMGESHYVWMLGLAFLLILIYFLGITYFKYRALRHEVRDTEDWVKLSLNKQNPGQGYNFRLYDISETTSPRVVYLCKTIIQQQIEISHLKRKEANKPNEPDKEVKPVDYENIKNVQELSSTLKTMTGLLNVYQRVDAVSDRTYILSQMTTCTDRLNDFFNQLNRGIQSSLEVRVLDLLTVSRTLQRWINRHVYGDERYGFSILENPLFRRALIEVGGHFIVYGLTSSLLIGLSHTERTWSMNFLPGDVSVQRPLLITGLMETIQDLVFHLGGTVEHVMDRDKLELIKFAFKLPEPK